MRCTTLFYCILFKKVLRNYIAANAAIQLRKAISGQKLPEMPENTGRVMNKTLLSPGKHPHRRQPYTRIL